jgi:hypothetical protein
MLFSFRQVFLAWFFVLCVGCSSFIFFLSFKKINVLQVCWLTKTMTKKTDCNTAEGLCVLASVCGIKPSPCLWVGLPGFIVLLMFCDTAGLCISAVCYFIG